MDQANFVDPEVGTLVPTIKGAPAFVPAPLPPRLDLACIMQEFGEASAALGGLKEIGTTLTNPYMVIRPLQRNEALRSSAMEGTFSTADDLAIVEALDSGAGTSADHEVYNYIRAIDYAVEEITNVPISHRMIRGMHRVLLEGVSKSRGSNKRPGEYKADQNWIGALLIQDARFVPPPPQEAVQSMNQLESFINSENTGLPPLIEAGLVHYQFETIHPFGDGNGRVGRMLITLQLLSKGLLDAPLLYLSPQVEKTKNEYIDAMFAVSTTGDWSRWLRYFLSTIRESCRETIDTIMKLNDLESQYRQMIQKETKSVSALAIAESLFRRPVLSIPDAAKTAGITYQAAKKSIEQLERLGIIAPIPGFENPKLFWSRRVIEISDGRTGT